MRELLVLGPEGGGKTLLVRRLAALLSAADALDQALIALAIAPTVGQEVLTLELQTGAVTVREVGGAVASGWASYLPACHALMYVVDLADVCSIATVMVHMHELFFSEGLKDKRILIVFNKADLVDEARIHSFLNTLRVKDLARRMDVRVECMIGSALELQYVEALVHWIAAAL